MRHKKWDLIKQIISDNWGKLTHQEMANLMNDLGVRKQNKKKIDKAFVAYAIKQMDKEQAKGDEAVKVTLPADVVVAEESEVDNFDGEAADAVLTYMVMSQDKMNKKTKARLINWILR